MAMESNRVLMPNVLERKLALEGFVTTRKTISAVISKWEKTGGNQDLPKVADQR
jgi:hypothetical protein